MAATDLSSRIFVARTEAFSGAGFDLVTQVEVWRGWGDIYIVSVHTGLSQAEASPDLRLTIQQVIATLLEDSRHKVEIRWAES
jgi:hypothetical protein